MTDAKWKFGDPAYGVTRHLSNTTIEQARPAVESALKAQGFGVLTEIDVKATMKKKLDADVPPYLILGACNPSLAHQALGAEAPIGLLMPCNVVLAEEPGGVAVSAVNTASLFRLVGRPEVEPLAKQVNEKLAAALESIEL
jgi:uncharacterized protein (DUF302 family)